MASHHHHRCCAGSGLRLPWESMEELGEEVAREPPEQDLVYIDAISNIAGQGYLQLLLHLYSVCICVPMPSMFVYTHVSLCPLCLCGGVCVWPREDAEVKATGKEMLRTRRGGTRRPQSEGAWSMYSAVTLSKMGMSKGWPVITLGRSSRNLKLGQIQNTLNISTKLLFLFGLVRGGALSEDSRRANQVA